MVVTEIFAKYPKVSTFRHPTICCDSYLCRVTVGSSGGLAHGEGHVGDGPLGDGDAVDELLRGGVHGVHPAHHLLQIHPHPGCSWDKEAGLLWSVDCLRLQTFFQSLIIPAWCLESPDCCPVPIMFCSIVTTDDCYLCLVLLL